MKICLTPKVHGVGGMVSFAARFRAGLEARGYQVSDDLEANDADAVLVIGGTRQLPGLWRARRSGVRVVQRLNGMNWVHRIRNTGVKHFVRAEYGNLLLAFIRARFASGIVYQSEFSRRWWERVYGPTRPPQTVVYNGVDLAAYSPDGEGRPPEGVFRLLMIEANLGGGYEMGLENGVELARRLKTQFPVELMVVGHVPPGLRADWQGRSPVPIHWIGKAPREQIPALARAAHLLYAADLHPACPNAVIEALACGLPVAAFDTGAIPELITPQAGRVVAYGADPWKIETPDLDGLALATTEILSDNSSFRAGARARAVEALGLERMIEGYLHALGAT